MLELEAFDVWPGKRNDLKSFEIGLGHAKFDRSRGHLFDRHGQAIELRHQSCEVLAVLAEKPGEIVSRQSLIDGVWSGRAVSDDSVAQCIAEIRRVLGDTDKRIIETVPREGYRLIQRESETRRSPKRLQYAVLLVMLAAGAIVYTWLRPAAPTGPPVIAVLPFDDFSSEPFQGQLTDAVSESIITMLARYPQLTVIARRSSFQFRESDLGIPEIARKLGADFVLEGSQRYDGSRVRITAQLIDGASDAHVWTDEIDVPLEDLLVTNNRITAKVANAVGHNVIDTSEARMSAGDVSALMISNAAQSRIMRDFTRENLLINLKEQEKAIRDYPDSAWGYLGQALALRNGLRHGWIEGDEVAAQERMYELARKAVELDPNNYMAYHALGRVLLHHGKLEEAIGAFRRGTELNPSSSLATMGLADALVNIGWTEEALEVIERLERNDPLYGFSLQWSKSIALWQAGDCAQALEGFLAMPSMPVASYKELAAIHQCLGNNDAAARAMSEYLDDHPGWTIARERGLRSGMWTAPGSLDRWLAALEASGLPRK